MQRGGLHGTQTIRLEHSDAAGVIFFPSAFRLEQEFFERWLEAGGMALREMLDGGLPPTPVVHCGADFRRPVRVGDRLEVRLAAVGIGRGSFTLEWEMELGGVPAISVRVRRASIDRASGRGIDLPERLRDWLAASQRDTSALS